MKHITRYVLWIVIAWAIAGCDTPPATTTAQEMPEINDTNCQPERLKAMEDKIMQKAVASKCFHRGTFTRSEQKGF